MISICPIRFKFNNPLWSKYVVFIALSSSLLMLFLVQLSQIEREMKECSKRDTQKEQESTKAPIINPGFGGPLLITHNGSVPILSRRTTDLPVCPDLLARLP